MSKKHKKQPEETTPAPEAEVTTAEEEAQEEAPEEAEAPKEPTLEEALAASREEVQKHRDLFLRERADMENYRKRVQREKEDLARYANEKILHEILPVIDNLQRAVEHAGQSEGDSAGLLEGVEMTLGQFQKVLEKFAVLPVASVGEAFDPAKHQAMGQVESAEHAPNTVVHELQKGYTLNDRLLRPAMVMIAKAPAEKETPAEGGE